MIAKNISQYQDIIVIVLSAEFEPGELFNIGFEHVHIFIHELNWGVPHWVMKLHSLSPKRRLSPKEAAIDARRMCSPAQHVDRPLCSYFTSLLCSFSFAVSFARLMSEILIMSMQLENMNNQELLAVFMFLKQAKECQWARNHSLWHFLWFNIL